MPLQLFVDNILKPNLRELQKGYDELHKGFNAVMSIDAYAAHMHLTMIEAGRDVFEELGCSDFQNRNDIGFRKIIADRCHAFRLIRDAAKANKHAKLENHNPIVNGSNDTTVLSVAYGQGKYGAFAYGGAPQLIITDVDGVITPLENAAEDAVLYLDGVAADLGLLPPFEGGGTVF